jgi:hypothetical protein
LADPPKDTTSGDVNAAAASTAHKPRWNYSKKDAENDTKRSFGG